MSLIFMDGFDYHATADLLKKWTLNSNTTISAAGGRRGGGAITLAPASGNYLSKNLGANYAALIVGAAFSITAFHTVTPQKILEFFDAGTTQADVRVHPNGTFSVTRNGVVLGTSTVSASVTGFQYLECKITFHATTGTVDLRLNGVSILALTGQNTQNTANAFASDVRLGQYASGSAVLYDDVYMCDTSGTTNNAFLGDVRIDMLLPNADGFYSQFTPSTGTSHFALVDEPTPNTTDYNDGLTVGHRDSYAMANLAALASQTVYAVQVTAAIMKDDAGAKSAAVMVRSGSVNADGASVALPTSQVYVSKIYEANPDGGVAWTEASVNALEAGVVVTG